MSPLSDSATTSIWPIRSFLYVPATRPDWIVKAINSNTEAVIIDLEDSVEKKEKVRARALVATAAATLRSRGVHAFLRINAVSEGGLDDIRDAVCRGLTGLVLPKAVVEDVRSIQDVLSYSEGWAGLAHEELCIIAMPETAAGIRSGFELAKASTRIRGLASGFGTFGGDIAWSCGFQPTLDGREQIYIQSKVVLDSRAAGAPYPIAGVFSPRIDDLKTLKLLMLRAKEFGFTGAAVIHPTHVKVANSVFRPTAEEVAYCKGLIAALEDAHKAGLGAVRYQDAMVDRAVLPRAYAVVAEAQRLERSGK